MLIPKRSKDPISLSLCYSLFVSTLLIPGCASKSARPTPSDVPVEMSAGLREERALALVGTSKVSRFVLNNGLTVLINEDHSSPTFAYHTWFRVGSRDEEVGRTGLAHLFEHMMFKQTKNLKDGEFDRILEGAGVEGENAFTSRDYTAYVQELPKEKLELIIKLESERIVNLVVDEKAFKTETEVVQNERRYRDENSPDGTIYNELFGLAFTQHPYRWPVVGYQKDLDSMNGEDARKFYKTHYSPNHAVVVVSGDVKTAETLAIINKFYGDIAPQERMQTPVPIEPLQAEPRRKELKLNIQVEKLAIAYHIPGVIHADIPALEVLEDLLTGGKSSRLHRALVETGIATSVEASDLEDKDPSLFTIWVNLQKGKKAVQAEAIVLRELARLAKEAPSEAEMKRVKNRMEFNFYSGLDTNSGKNRFMGFYEVVAGDFRAGLKQHEDILKVTPTQVSQVTQRYFDPNGRTVLTGVQK